MATRINYQLHETPVLMVTERYLPIWGGAENQLRQLVKLLTEQHCDVEIVTRRWHRAMSSYELIDGIPVYRVGMAGAGPLATLTFVLSLLAFLLRRRHHYRIVHSHGAANMGALIAFSTLFSDAATVAKIATAGRIPHLNRTPIGRGQLALFKRVDKIVCMSQEILDELNAVEIEPARIEHIQNGVDGERFRPATEIERAVWRAEKGLPDSAVIVAFSGRLVQRKGVDVLIDAWERIDAVRNDAHLFLLGSGTDQPDSVEAELIEKVRSRKIANVHFEGDVPAPEDYLNVADIFAFPSRKEGFPNALLEGMAAGAIAVASRIGGNEDLITNGDTGILFNLDDVDALSATLQSLIEDPAKRKIMATRGRAHVLEHNAMPVIAQKYSHLYTRLVD